MAKKKTARDRYEESLRGPEPRSYMFIIATIVWIILTAVVVAALMYFEPNSRQLPKHIFFVIGGSASLYAISAHQNRMGDRNTD